MAELEFNFAAMNAGKTLEVIARGYNHKELGHEIAVLKPEEDTKSEKFITSRTGLELEADIITNSEMNLREEIAKLGKTALRAVLIDEVQFLTKDHISQLYEVAKEDNIPVAAYGLLTTFKGELFKPSAQLIIAADKLREIETTCLCGEKARFNALKLNGEYVFELDNDEESNDENNIVVDKGEGVQYSSMCGPCYKQIGGTI